jgi:hypothetical protein
VDYKNDPNFTPIRNKNMKIVAYAGVIPKKDMEKLEILLITTDGEQYTYDSPAKFSKELKKYFKSVDTRQIVIATSFVSRHFRALKRKREKANTRFGPAESGYSSDEEADDSN